MTSFALVLKTYELTRSSIAVGAIGLAQAIPSLVVGLLGGSLADAVDRRRLVLATSGCLIVISAVFGLPVALFPALNAERFGGSPQTLGLLSTALAAGGLLGSVLSGPAGRVPAKARAMLVTVVIWGAAITGFGFAHLFWLALLLLVLAGAADATTVIFRAAGPA